jgi:DNA polymerase III delta prime subunit
MRAIEDLTNTTSFVSNKKVIIIDELQELSGNKKAQKNLLKALEKENKETYFILLSMDDGKVDRAVKNRAVTYKLYPVDYMKIAEYLYNICSKMNVELDEAKTDILFTVAQNSGGSVRQACAYLERVIEGNIWNEAELIDILHITTDSQINDMAIKLIDANPSIFEKDITEEILQRVKLNLIDMSKLLVGAKLEQYKMNSLQGLSGYKNANLENVYGVIETLNELFNFPYINKEIIDSILIKLFLKNKHSIPVVESPKVEPEKKQEVIEEQPKRRRV